MPNKENKIYLTFDDGPIPEVTPWVLDVLKIKNIPATFFCVGANVDKYPELYQRILKEGHSVGNHTYHHVSGWKMKNEEYKAEIDLAAKVIRSNLFRPPYGQISPGQLADIRHEYKIIMWDVLSKDYDQSLAVAQVIDNVISTVKSGSIIVMHYSLKAEKNLRGSLEITIDQLTAKGFLFCAIPNEMPEIPLEEWFEDEPV
ncbi:MAG: polysaccharide deacetylase family protein [Saprospiraceae bacterium]|nr:polysaccharide deacetylase family protein [Saprospiraceae bacterium]